MPQQSVLLLEIQTKVHPKVRNHGEGPIRAFSWLKAATTASTFKTLLRHYAKRTLTPQSLNAQREIGSASQLS